MPEAFLDLQLREFLDRLAAPRPGPGGGSADVASRAALAAEMGEGTFRGDAAAAALLAEAAARAAGKLVAVNLTVTGGDERLVRARRNEQLAGEAAARALDAGA